MRWAVTLLATLACGLHVVRGDTNNKWQPNDDLIGSIDQFFVELSGRPHVYSQNQRFFAIVTLALSYYISDREGIPTAQRVHNAVENTRKQLGEPTEAIGGIVLNLLRILRSIIDKPINDIKVCCPPNVAQGPCDACLQKTQARNEQYCKGYMRSVKYYGEIVLLFTDKQIPELVAEITRSKSQSDNDALSFFSSAANGKYLKLMKRMREEYQKQIHTYFPCNALNTPPF